MKYSETYEIMSHDMSADCKIKISSLWRYLQETANHQMRDCKPTYKELFADGKAFILSRMSLSIYQQISEYDNITVETWSCSKSGVQHNRSYRVLKGFNVIAEAYSVWALVDINTHGFYRIGEVNLENYGYDEPLIPSVPIRFKIPEKIKFTYVGNRTVRYSDTDCNYHMNNCFYPDMICDFLPDISETTIKAVCINYVNEAPLGQELKIYISEPKNLEDGEKEYYFKTVINDKINIIAIVRTNNYRTNFLC